MRWQLVFTVLLIFPVLTFSVASVLIREKGVPSIRLRGSGDVPQLTLHEGHRYHLFNSHVWSTGQDVAATIKRQLQRLFPDVRVFLDVCWSQPQALQ